MSRRLDSSSQDSSAASTVKDPIAPVTVIDYSLPDRFLYSTIQEEAQPPVLVDDSELSEHVSGGGNDAIFDVEHAGEEVLRMVTTCALSRSDPEEETGS